MVKVAWNFILPLLALAAACLVQSLRLDSPAFAWAAALLAALAAFCANFFRDPPRRVPADPGLLVAPADGRVIAIEPVQDAYVGRAVEIRIFLNVFDVHVQRSPFTVPSRVEATRYFAGKFMAASLPKAALENEQHWIRLAGRGRARVVVKQIAGLIARRIISWVRPGDTLAPGQHLGLIQFGSQVDLVVPRGWKVLAVPGQRVKGGETPLARRGRGRS